MVTEKIKTLVVNFLGAIGGALCLLGYCEYKELIHIITTDFDPVVVAFEVIVGFLLTIFSWFRENTKDKTIAQYKANMVAYPGMNGKA